MFQIIYVKYILLPYLVTYYLINIISKDINYNMIIMLYISLFDDN